MDAQTIAMLIQIVVTITAISVLGFFLALFSYFLDFCFWPKNIFSFWLPFLASQILKAKDPVKFKYIMAIDDKEEREQSLIDAMDGGGLFKMLGGCAICLNVWIGMITFPILAHFLQFSLWYYPIYLLSASFFLRKIMKVD